MRIVELGTRVRRVKRVRVVGPPLRRQPRGLLVRTQAHQQCAMARSSPVQVVSVL